jgi:flagellar biosynthesis protein FlhF
MRLKTYFATSVEAAMLLALEQLGPEAMIVNSHRTATENRHLGEYEVIFAVAPEDQASDHASAQFDASYSGSSLTPGPEAESELVKRLYSQVSRLASEIESLGRVMKRTEAKQKISNFEGEPADVAHCLAEAGFSDDFTMESIQGAGPVGGSLRFRVLQAIAARLKIAPSLGRIGQGRKVSLFVGPSGAGKSSLIAKLAMRSGVAARRPCQILSLDSERIGSVEPLRMVAGVLGVGFRVIEESSGLGSALDTLRGQDLVLIDSPGFARDEGEAINRLSAVVSVRPEIDVHLVLPATMKQRDLDRVIQLYLALHPQKVAFTRLDETDQIGAVIETAIRAGLPVSFVSGGPRVPEDLEPANATHLCRRMFLSVGGSGFVRRAAA